MYNQNHRLRIAFLTVIPILICTAAQCQDSLTKIHIADSICSKRSADSNNRKKSIRDSISHLPVEVIAVYNHKYRDSNGKDSTKRDENDQSSGPSGMASIGDVIVVRVSNIDSLIRRAKCKDSNGNDISGNLCKPQEIRLFINGRMMKDIHPEDGAPQLDAASGQGELQFRLDRNQDNDEIWADILGAPTLFSSTSFKLPVKISIGLENDYALAVKGNGNNFRIERIHQAWFWFCFVGSILYLALLVMLVLNFGLLRDRVINLNDTGIQPLPGTTSFPAPPINPPYSLGRLQMAFWFSIVVMSFLFIWLITDAYDILTASVLGLIGISAGTSLSATVIDNNKQKELINETKELQIKAADPATPAPEKRQMEDKIKANIKELTPQKSEGFFADVLHDANGISFHRMQMLVWTLVLGLLFVYTVWRRLSMPDFDTTLMALTGITAGTYLGFKFPEKQS